MRAIFNKIETQDVEMDEVENLIKNRELINLATFNAVLLTFFDIFKSRKNSI